MIDMRDRAHGRLYVVHGAEAELQDRFEGESHKSASALERVEQLLTPGLLLLLNLDLRPR